MLRTLRSTSTPSRTTVKTPANQWTVLVVVAASIAAGLWGAGLAVQRSEPAPLAADHDFGFSLESGPTPAHLLANPVDEARRGIVERPFDEARCGTNSKEATITTTLEDENGKRIGGAHVVLFECDANGPRTRDFVESATADDGRACVRTKWTGTLLVAVFATGFATTARRVDSAVGSRVDLEPFVLERGAEIAGTVLVGGQPLARAEVVIATCLGCDVLEVGGLRYAWRTDRFVRASTTAHTDAQGNYAATGLDRGEHVVRLLTVRQRDVAVDVNRVAAVRVNAPKSHVDFALPAARLELDIRSKGVPLCCVEVQIEAGDRQFTRTSDDAGRLVVMLQPALAYPLILTRRGFETKRMQLRGLIDGERLTESVELDLQSVTARVVVDDEAKAGVDTAVFVFRPRSPLMHGSAFERTVQRDAATKMFVIADVPSGNWMVTLRSGRTWSAPSTMDGDTPVSLRSNCDVEFAVNVPDSGVVTPRVGVNRRGGVELLVRDQSGATLSARAKVFDSRGDEVAALMVEADALAVFGIAHAPRSDEATFVLSAGCFGPFEIAVHKAGFRTRRVPFTLVSGQIGTLEVVLEAE